MNLTLVTDDGKTVRLADAMLLEVKNVPGGAPGRAEFCAVVNVHDDLADTQTEGVRALPTKLGFVVGDDHAFAVLHVLCGSTLLVTALDLADPATQALMVKAPSQGFAVAIIGAVIQKVVRVPVAHLQAEIAERGMAAKRAASQSKADVIAFLLRRLGDSEGLESLGLQGTAFDQVLLSFASASADRVDGGGWSAGASASKLMH